jgi:hypothetical protein
MWSEWMCVCTLIARSAWNPSHVTLGPTKEKRFDSGVQFPNSDSSEKKLSPNEGEERNQIVRMILDRSAGQRPRSLPRDASTRNASAGVHGLDPLRFVEDHEIKNRVSIQEIGVQTDLFVRRY